VAAVTALDISYLSGSSGPEKARLQSPNRDAVPTHTFRTTGLFSIAGAVRWAMRKGSSPNPENPVNPRRRALSTGSKKALHLGCRAPESGNNASGKLDPNLKRKEPKSGQYKTTLYLLLCQQLTDSRPFQPSRLYAYKACSKIAHCSSPERPNAWAKGKKTRLNLATLGCMFSDRASRTVIRQLPNVHWGVWTNNPNKFRRRPLMNWREMFKGVPNLMKAEELAEVLRIGPKTPYSWAAAGRIPHVRINSRLLRFIKEEIIAWLEKGNFRPGYNT
jgi:excisionase family DNA binding protein